MCQPREDPPFSLGYKLVEVDQVLLRTLVLAPTTTETFAVMKLPREAAPPHITMFLHLAGDYPLLIICMHDGV